MVAGLVDLSMHAASTEPCTRLFLPVRWLVSAQTDMNRATSALGPLVASAIWGFSFMHDYLDKNIWRVRQDPELRSVFGFPDPPETAVVVAGNP